MPNTSSIPFALMLQAIERSYTLRSIRTTLYACGFDVWGNEPVSTSVLIGSPEFVLAAAMARATVGA